MTLSVLNVGDQVLTNHCLPRVSLGKHILKCLNNNIYNLNISLLVVTADIIGLEESALLLNHINSLGVILNIEPVSDVQSVAVYRKLLAMKCIVNNKRNQLLRELVGSVVIAAVSNICRELVGVHIRLNQHIRACLACRIGAVRLIRAGLIEEGTVIIRKRTVYLVGRYM